MILTVLLELFYCIEMFAFRIRCRNFELSWCVDLSWQLSHHPVAHSLSPSGILQWDGGENWKDKGEENSQDEIKTIQSVNEEEKTPSDAKVIAHQLPPTDQCPAILRAIAAFTKLLPRVLLLSLAFYVMESLFG